MLQASTAPAQAPHRRTAPLVLLPSLARWLSRHALRARPARSPLVALTALCALCQLIPTPAAPPLATSAQPAPTPSLRPARPLNPSARHALTATTTRSPVHRARLSVSRALLVSTARLAPSLPQLCAQLAATAPAMAHHQPCAHLALLHRLPVPSLAPSAWPVRTPPTLAALHARHALLELTPLRLAPHPTLAWPTLSQPMSSNGPVSHHH